jgi:hypothetical protein
LRTRVERYRIIHTIHVKFRTVFKPIAASRARRAVRATAVYTGFVTVLHPVVAVWYRVACCWAWPTAIYTGLTLVPHPVKARRYGAIRAGSEGVKVAVYTCFHHHYISTGQQGVYFYVHILNAVAAGRVGAYKTQQEALRAAAVYACFVTVLNTVEAGRRWAGEGTVGTTAVYSLLVAVHDAIFAGRFTEIGTWKTTVYATFHHQPV